MADERESETAGQGYVAVVHCHGMGSQRRYEEMSRMIDALDRYARSQGAAIMRINARPEMSRAGDGGVISHVRSAWRDATGGVPQQVRFYEIYWAPIMAGQKSARRVLLWLFSQVFRPWRTVGTPWRERQRLRRAVLASMFEGQADRSDFERLSVLYDDYEGLDAQRAHGKGDFAGFEAMIRANASPEDRARLAGIAREWRRRYLADEWRNAFVLATAALGALLLFASLAGVVLSVLGGSLQIGWIKDLIANVFKVKEATWPAAISLASAVMLFVLGRFLTDALGDVEAWSTYRETDEKNASREKIKDEAVRILRHVLADPQCSRVLLVSHSLGTTIAHDSLLALTRQNRAAGPSDPLAGPIDLRKIEHFVTLGSPIDKVEYFFESYRSQSHRYKRVVEKLRGDIGTAPFTRERHPHLPQIHWINFWDAGDPVSGALQSPTNPKRFTNRVDNVHVRNWAFPDPGASHLAYFDNAIVVGTLFEIVGGRTGSYVAEAALPPARRDYAALAFAPRSVPAGSHRFFLSMALLLPWIALFGALFWATGLASPWALAPAGVVAAVLAGGYLVGRVRGQRNPIAGAAAPAARP